MTANPSSENQSAAASTQDVRGSGLSVASGSESLSSSAAFERWWHEEGSGMPPKENEDRETHMRRVAEIAWSNGAYLAEERVTERQRIVRTLFQNTTVSNAEQKS